MPTDTDFLHAILSSPAADWLQHADALAWHPEHSRHPMPATAVPLEEVRLTTWPTRNFVRHPGGEWPWLRFTLPEEPQ